MITTFTEVWSPRDRVRNIDSSQVAGVPVLAVFQLRIISLGRLFSFSRSQFLHWEIEVSLYTRGLWGG